MYNVKNKIAQIYSQSRQINGVKTKDNTVLSLVKQINSQKCDFENGHHLKKWDGEVRGRQDPKIHDTK